MAADGLAFGVPSASATTTGHHHDDGLDFGGYPVPPEVPPDPLGDDWRGPPGPPGPPGSGTAGVDSFNTRTGPVTLTLADVTGVGGAPLASPTFIGNPKAPTPAPGDSDTSIATTAFVAAAIGAAGGASITVSDTAPTLANGALWFDSVGTQLYVGYNDGTSLQWVIATASTVTDPFGLVNVRTFGAKGDNTADDTASFNAAIAFAMAHQRSLYVPSGNYRLTAQIVITFTATLRGISISGDGQEASKLTWAGGQGMVINLYDQYNAITVRDLVFLTGALGTGSALRIVGPANVPGPGFESLRSIERCLFRGAAGYSNAGAGQPDWSVGIDLYRTSNYSVVGCGFAAREGVGFTGVNLVATSTNQACVYNFTNCVWMGGNVGINYGDYIQGVTVNACNFTALNYGIYANAVGGAVAEGTQLAVVNSQFAADVCGIDITTPVTLATITGSLFLSYAGTSGIVIGDARVLTVTGNIFDGVSGTTVGLSVGGSTLGGIIADNQFYNLTTALNFQGAGAGSFVVGTNLYTNCTNTVAKISPTYTVAVIGEYLSAIRASTSPITLTSNVDSDVASLVLPPGDWDVEGNVRFNLSGGNASSVTAFVNTVSATDPVANAGAGMASMVMSSATIASGVVLATGTRRYAATTATTVYLECWSQFSGTASAFGTLRARRVSL